MDHAVVDVIRLSLNVERARLKVEVRPFQRADLAASHTRCQLEQSQLIEVVLLRLNQEPAHLIVGEHLHFLRFFRRQLAAVGGIDGDQLFLYRFLQCRAAGGMAGAHHAV